MNVVKNHAEAIRNCTAVAVSDGSFKEGYGTAAWVIEGETEDSQLLGRIIAPGGQHNQSPYRSELTGILAAIIMIKKKYKSIISKKGRLNLPVTAYRPSTWPSNMSQ